MFSQASVILSTGGCTPPWADKPPPGRQGPHRQTSPPPADTPPLGETPTPGDSQCSGRYASYWNAFLLSLRTWVFNHQILNCKVEEVAAISNQDTFLFKHIYNNVRCQTSDFLFIHIHQLAALKSFPCSLVAISTMGLGGLYLRSDFLVTFADQVFLKDKWNLIKKKYNLTWIKVFCINFEMKPGWIANCRSDLNWFEVSILLKFGCCQIWYQNDEVRATL